MHYKNGREAKVGDKIVYPKFVDVAGLGKHSTALGIVVSTNAGCSSCNAQVIPHSTPSEYVTIGQCLHVEDAGFEQDAVNAVKIPS